MLEVFDALEPFFRDNYREYGVREYARETDVSAPTASKRLKGYAAEGLLVFREDRGVHLYRAHRTSAVFLDLQRAYYRRALEPIVGAIRDTCFPSRVVLFGSALKGSLGPRSDLDVFVDASPCDLQVPSLHGHEIQIHFHDVLANASVAAAIDRGAEL